MTAVITDLVQTLEDGRKGFADAADSLQEDGNTELASTFRNYAEQRADFATQLRAFAGDTIEEDGSVAGALHRGWIDLKDAMTGDDPVAIVNAALTGEEHAVSEYEKALDDQDLPTAASGLVRRQAMEIKQVRDKLQQIA